MAPLRGAEAALLGGTLIIFYLTVGWCQGDCTGVDCPLLDNCIQEVLESGVCCASCLQRGCTCEGYQYYDCLNAGFKNGKVSEGESYFVDYGSTECSCPAGGGRISCHFISCPEIPQNCIDVSEPADGCTQCERIGCVHGGKKYEAGHSFHIDPCRVCHCPNEGGKLMCYPVPDCDPKEILNLMLVESREQNPAGRADRFPYKFDQQNHKKQFPTTRDLLPNANVPPFNSPPLDKQEQEDYDYGPTDFREPSPQSLPFPSRSSSSSKLMPLFRESETSEGIPAFQSYDRGSKLELIERYGVQDHRDNKEATEDPQSTVRPHVAEDTTNAWQHSDDLTSLHSGTFDDQHPPTHNPLPGQSSLGDASFPSAQDSGGRKHDKDSHEVSLTADSLSASTEGHRNASNGLTPGESHLQTDARHRAEGADIQANANQSDLNSHKESQVTDNEDEVEADDMEEEDGDQSVTEPQGKDVSYNIQSAEQDRNDSESSSQKTTPLPTTNTPPRGLDYHTTPMFPVVPTTTTVTAQLHLSRSQGQRFFNLQRKDVEEVKNKEERKDPHVFLITPDEGPNVAVEDLLMFCCTSGQRWATEHQHCSHIPLLDNDKQSTCMIAQKQCCLSTVRESQCESGLTSARQGDTCEVQENDQCTHDSYQVCCSCCALGLWARNEGRGCNEHQYLAYPCGHIFLTCCEEEGLSQIPLKRRQKPKATAKPERVSDSKFPKEAFSISATDDAANTVEEPEDVDECQLYAGQLCQHTCINAWGSYRCECHQGYILQQDRHSCAPVSPDEDNGVREHIPALIPTQIPTVTTTSRTSTSPVHQDPCAGNGPCSQQCTVLAGRARCFCFPGFSLMTDRHTCQDVDECMSSTHSCRSTERCVNTVGSFVCELQVACPAGYQLRNGNCEDVDECVLRTHSCGGGSVCENTLGSFLCKTKHKCVSGFTQDAHGNCIDINECSSPSGPCSPGFNCINTVGSFTCQKKVVSCSRGYHASPDGAKCVDIDECQVGTHRCGGGQICHNLPGSYRCDCRTGYQYDALRKVCADVNECWRYAGRLCSQTCENTPGSYHCSCTAGFSLAFDGKNCEDVNECDGKPCSQECANIYGSYQCYCRQGYYLKEDGHSCEDIDECSQSMGNLCAFQCVNVAGSYTCECPPQGYVMTANGRTCKDVDECTTGTHNCSFGQSCYNLQGGFRCLAFNCPPNYNKVSDTRCERISCPTNSLDCQNSPMRITYYQLSFKTNIIIPAQIFRIGPSPAYSGDHIIIGITKGNEEGFFSTRKLNSFTGAVYLQRQVREPKDFLIDVEMKLLRQGAVTSFVARIYVFITSSAI